MRKTMLVAVASVFGICVLVIAAKAATTWQGPPTNCTSPEGSSCNTNGVIWNQTTPQTASFNITGTGRAASGLTVDAGEINTGNLTYLKPNGDIWLTDGKSIAINQVGTSHLLMGNWGADPNSKIELTIFGDLKIYKEVGGTYTPKLYASNMCLGPEGAETCITSWPAVGGGGTVTSISQGTGITATPNPITGAGTIALDTTYSDGRYVNTVGDTMTGQLNIDRSPAAWPSINAVNGIQSGSFSQFYDQLSVNSPGVGVYAAAPTAGSFMGTALGIVASAEPGGAAGTFQNKPSGLAVTKRVDFATKDNAIEAIMGDIKLNTGNRLCFDVDCRSSWPAAGGGGDVTDVLAGTGISMTNAAGPQPTVSLQTGYQMPQSCTNGQVPKSNGSGVWVCATDMNSGGTVTAVNAGAGILSSGGATPSISLDTSFADGRYLNATVADTMTVNAGTAVLNVTNSNVSNGYAINGRGYLYGVRGESEGAGVFGTAVGTGSGGLFQNSSGLNRVWLGDATNAIQANGRVSMDGPLVNYGTSRLDGNITSAGLINLRSSSVAGGVVALQVGGNEALWYNGTYFSWGYGGSYNYFADSVGIGLSSSDMRFDVDGRIRLRGSPAAWNAAGMWYYDSDLASDQVFTGMVTGSATKSSRVFGIWINDAWNFQFRGDGKAYSTGGSWASLSDERLKKDVEPIHDAVGKLSKLNGIYYKWKNPSSHNNEDGTRGGFIAQEVEKVFPDWVDEIDVVGDDKNIINDGKAKTIQLPFEFDALVVESIKELKVQNDMLQAENDMLLHRIEALEAKIK